MQALIQPPADDVLHTCRQEGGQHTICM
jgi:hypothetical protein